jgi:hypothetical protein
MLNHAVVFRKNDAMLSTKKCVVLANVMRTLSLQLRRWIAELHLPPAKINWAYAHTSGSFRAKALARAYGSRWTDFGRSADKLPKSVYQILSGFSQSFGPSR